MADELDGAFTQRASAFIDLANEQTKAAARDSVGGSFMLANARFSAWVLAMNSTSAEIMAQQKQARIDALAKSFRMLLEEEYDFYAVNYRQLVLGETD